jgi:general secretion pathway protein D
MKDGLQPRRAGLRRALSRWIACSMLLALLSVPFLAQQPAAQQQPPVPIGNINIGPNGSLREVVNQLAQALKINIVPDPKLAGNVTINTYGEVRNLDARNLLEMILRINGFGMVADGDLYRIVPMKDVLKQPMPIQRLEEKDVPDDDRLVLNLIFLKYVTVDELTKVIDPFTGDNAVMLPYAPANLLFILDSGRNMKRLMDLISLFDSDTFANQRVRLFELKNARPSDMVKDLKSILQSISLDPKNSTIQFLAVDRISTLIVVASNTGVFDTVAEWIKKLDVPVTVTAGEVDVYVYHVRYQRADCLAIALTSLFGGPVPATPASGAYQPYGSAYGNGGGAGGAYGAYGAVNGPYSNGVYGGIGGAAPAGGSYGAPNNFQAGFGGTGACGGTVPGAGGGAVGYPAFGGFSAQAPLTGTQGEGGVTPSVLPGAAAGPAPGAAGSEKKETPPRIVALPLDNSLMIQADAQKYQGILKLLNQLDVPPRQILLDCKIYSIDLTDQFSAGVTGAYSRQNGADTSLLGNLGITTPGTVTLSVGGLVGASKQLLAFINLSENIGHTHLLSEPSLIATDSIPATINTGTQVPVSTGTTTLPTSGGVAVAQNISGVSTGITLQVYARINPSGVVTLVVNQENSSIPQSNPSGTLTPTISQQVVQTQITTEDGATIAIGGVIQETTTITTAGIPFLDRIPYLGWVFGNKSYNHERSELLLFMTPHVIRDMTELLEASEELRGEMKKLQKYIRF